MNCVIKLKNIKKSYKNQIALNGIHMNIKRGSIYGLVGANGAGKTTIMKSILALTAIDSGTIEIFGKEVNSYRDVPYFKIGNMIEAPSFYPTLSAKENLQVICKGKGVVGRNSIDEALAKVGLNPKDSKIFAHYSLGMKQRLGLANAIISNPTLLILDEPTNGLDPNGIIEVRNILKHMNQEFGTTILISSHILSEIAEIADTVGAIKEGVIVEECPISQIYNNSKKHIKLSVNNVANIPLLLERELNIQEYEVISEEEIRIFTTPVHSWEINELLVKRGIRVNEMICSDKNSNYLEEFYMELMEDNDDSTFTG